MSKRKLIRAGVFLISALHFFLPSQAQVNLQTGSAVFSIPMFNWQDDKSRLMAGVGLVYNSGNGLKVSEPASNVGQGWSLLAGGEIVRLQVGEPDDQQAYGSTNSLDISRYPNGYLYAQTPPANGCPSELASYPIYKARNQLYTLNNELSEDKQPDYFSFQFNGKAGIFILDKVHGTGMSLGDNKMKISFATNPTSMLSQGIRTTITTFTIQDVDGLKYVFAQQVLTKVLHADFCNANQAAPVAQPNFAKIHIYHQAAFENSKIINPYVVTGWYLSEIDDPLTGRKISFIYPNKRNISTTAGADVSYNQEGEYVIISHKNSKTQTPALKYIVYPDGHIVTLTYGNARSDMNGDSVLTAVDVTYQGRTLSEYRLKSTYFLRNRYGNPVTSQQLSDARLCLQSVTKIGPDLKEDNPPYVFDYYMGSDASDDFVPPPFFQAKDIWGYYNGDQSVANDNSAGPSAIYQAASVSQLTYQQLMGLCFLNVNTPGKVYLNPKTNYAKNGLLRQVLYPTGGTINYTYGQNKGVLDPLVGEVTVGGVHVISTSSTDGGHSNGCSNPITTNYSYTVNGDGTASSLWGLEMPVNQALPMASHYQSEDKRFHITWSNPFGECYWNYAYPGILSSTEAIDLPGMLKLLTALGPALGVLGVVMDVVDVLNLVFVSTGVLAWVAVIVDFVSAILGVALTCFSGNNAKDNTSTVFYNADMNGASPLPAQFKRVEVVENPGTIGKTVHVFTSSDDYPVFIPANGNTKDFSAKQRFAPWAYGLPLTTTIYDVNNNKVKETDNHYGFADCLLDSTRTVNVNASTPAKLSADSSGSCSQYKMWHALPLTAAKCTIKHMTSQRNTDWSNDVGNTYILSPTDPNITVDIYSYYTGRLELKSTVETDYQLSNGSQGVQTTKSFYYNNTSNYELRATSTQQSNGDVINEYFTYSSDYPTTQNVALKALALNNAIAEPVSEVRTIIPKGSSTESMLSEHVTEYVLLSNGEVKQARKMEQRFVQPSATAFRYKPDNAGNTGIYKVVETFAYDINGNFIGMKDEGGRASSNIYGYQDKYIIASVINADPLIDRPAYTSFEDTAFGGWAASGSPVYINGGITGSRAFQLTTSSSLSSIINTSKGYTLSFWATAAVTVNSGAVLKKSAPVINGYTYYEYNIPQGAGSVTVSGTANVDEMRLYPVAARMKTVTYDPLLGKTSECDMNNRVTYYEYDNVGRLQFVKDENHYVMKMYEYNNISSAIPVGCPATYSNHLITEMFTRSNCSAGYQGGDAPYSVSAAKYTSNISQADADAKAELDLLVNGPANANINGACNLIYYNVAKSQQDSTESCDPGKKGGFVIYTVPPSTYSSIISQADADQQAIDDVNANAVAYANATDTRSCLVDNSPDWEWTSTNTSLCTTFGTDSLMHMFFQATDMNPASPTYNQVQYKDSGPSTSCPLISPCFFSYTNSVTGISANLGKGPGTTNTFQFIFNTPSFYSGSTIGVINGSCRPSSPAITIVGNWRITIGTDGSVTLALISGFPSTFGTQVTLAGSYNLLGQ